MDTLLKAAHRVYRRLTPYVSFLFAQFFILLGLISDRVVGNIAEPSLVVSRIPFFFGEKLRYYYYRRLLIAVGKGVTFKYGSFCQYRNTRIGNRVLIGYFDTIGEATIGDHVLIGGHVDILSGVTQHAFNDPEKLIWDTPAPGRRMITIGSDVWIGNDAVICNDIGSRCVVAVNSVVLRRVRDHTLVGGNPATKLMKI